MRQACANAQRNATRRDPSVANEEEAAARLAAAGADDGDLRRRRDLPLAGFPPHLRGRLVQEPVAAEPARRELSAVRIQRQLAVARDPLPALDEGTALADGTEPQRLEPRHREEREPVVELSHLDVRRLEIGARLHL